MELITWFNENIVWGVPTLALFLFTGGYFSLRTAFFQLRRFGRCMRQTVLSPSVKQNGDNSITAFQAMTSALAATLGTGNIAGVSAAIATGGAGAVFWMWISSLLGMMTGYAENVLGHLYRRRINGKWQGGAMRYISAGLAENPHTQKLAKPLAAIFAVLCTLTAFGMGNMAQMNTAANALKISFGINPIISGIILAAAAGIVIAGGIKRTACITEKIVPLMSIFYMAGAAYIIITHFTQLPQVLGSIMEGAFGLTSIAGGINGYVVKQAVSLGLRRGVFSNEAGLGTSVAAHAASAEKNPCVQGMWSIFEVFFDTIVMCTVTALVLLCTPCNAPSLSQCVNSISTQPQFFRLTDAEGLITEGAPLLISGSGEALSCRTIHGDELTIYVHEEGLTFSNIMSITGVQEVSDDGTPLYKNGVPLITSAEISPVSGVGLANYAFSQTFGAMAGKLLSAAVTLFAFTTVIGWSQFGAGAVEYLFGERAVVIYRILFVAAAAAGAASSLELIWCISDTFNGLMAIPNLFAVLMLSPKVIALTRQYESELS